MIELLYKPITLAGIKRSFEVVGAFIIRQLYKPITPAAVKRFMKVVTALVAIVITPYALAIVSFRAEPSGYVEGYSMICHEENDTLEFSNGKVTARTCCGDMPMGTYEATQDGRWIWHSQLNPRAPTGDVIVESHLFWLTFSGATDMPWWNHSVRRKLLTDRCL